MKKANEDNRDLRAKLEASEKQVAALRSAVVKLRASSSEVSKISAKQQKQHEEDQKALEEARLREADLLMRCTTAEKRLAESEESCKNAKALAEELRSREHRGNFGDLEEKSNLHTLLSEAVHSDGSKTHNDMLISIMKCLVNLPRTSLAQSFAEKELPETKRKRADGETNLDPARKRRCQNPSFGVQTQKAELDNLTEQNESEKLAIDLTGDWLQNVINASNAEERGAAISELLRGMKEETGCTPEIVATCMMINFAECCHDSWHISLESLPDFLDDAVNSAGEAKLVLDRTDLMSGFIEDLAFSSFWMTSEKTNSLAFSSLLHCVCSIYSQAKSGVGGKLMHSLQQILTRELIINHRTHSKDQIFVDCGLVTALTILFRYKSKSQAVRMLLLNLLITSQAKDFKDLVPLITALLCAWPGALKNSDSVSCTLFLNVLEAECVSILRDKDGEKEEVTQLGPFQDEPSIAYKRGPEIAAKCLHKLGQTHYNWVQISDTDVIEEKVSLRICKETLHRHLSSLMRDPKKRAEIDTVMCIASSILGPDSLCHIVQKLVSGDSAFRDTQKESLSHLKILLGSLCKVHGSKGHENLFKDLPVHTEMYNDVYLEDI